MGNLAANIDDLPLHLILEILTCGGLGGVDLVCLELSCKLFRHGYDLVPLNFKSLGEFAAFRLCGSNSVFVGLSDGARDELLARCGACWKRVLRFLQSVNESSDVVQTYSGNTMQIRSGRYHTLLIKDSKVYSCGSSLCGVLGHGPETTQCAAFTRIKFPYHVNVTHVSASHNHAAFVTQSGEVATGVSFTMFLTTEGQVYTCGINTQGQLGHGDTLDRSTPKLVEGLVTVGPVVQITAGPSYALAVTSDGSVYSFGSGTNFCLGHGEQHSELSPRPLQWFRRKGIHVVRVSAGDEHVVALDSNGYVYTWGKGYCGALGHGDEIDKTTPELLTSLKTHLAVQVCASKRKTFVLIDNGCLYGFGWMGFGSLGFPDRGVSDKVLKPSRLNSLKDHHISQVSTGLYHSVVLSNRGQIFGFGDNERAQLGHDKLRNCRSPTETLVEETSGRGAFRLC